MGGAKVYSVKIVYNYLMPFKIFTCKNFDCISG